MKRLLPLFLCLCLLAGCGAQARTDRTVFAMDTVMSLGVYGPDSALDQAEQEIYRLDRLLSISSPDGDIATLNQCGAAQLTPETAALLRRALDIAEETGGCYDPTVYPLVDLWGFYGDAQQVPETAKITEALTHVGYAGLALTGDDATLNQGLLGVDLGGIAKGYASEQVISVLRDSGAQAAILSLGGNVATLGKKPGGTPWTVGVEDPEKTGDTLGTLALTGDWFAVTSGAYERFFEENGVRYHHILDPATGYPAETDLKSVTVVSQDGTLADGLSTALFVMGFADAVDFWQTHRDQFGLVLITADGIFVTPNLEFTSSRSFTTLEERT